MAAPEMADMALLLTRYHDKFPADFQAELAGLIESADHYDLFKRIEDLIAAHKLDHLLSREDNLRRALCELYGARHPWLATADLGAAAWQREQERALAAFRERAARDRAAGVSRDMAQYEHELSLARAHVAKFGIQLPGPAPGPASDVPLAPSMGGVPPRQPFTAGWTFREAPAAEGISFDPKATCEQFLPQSPVVVELSDSDEDGDDDEPTTEDGDVLMRDVGQEAPEREPAPGDAVSAMISSLGGDGTTETTTKTTTKRPDEVIVVGDSRIRLTPETRKWNAPELKGHIENLLRKRGNTSQVVTLAEVQKMLDTSAKIQDKPVPKTPQGRHVQEEDEITPPQADTETTIQIPTPETSLDSDVKTELRRKALDAHSLKHGVQQSETTGRETSIIPAGSRDYYDENWLKNWLIHNDMATPDDLKMFSYGGWRIHSPKITLIRIKNFLADEDLDRTLLWTSQRGEILLYLQHLQENVYDGQDWGYDLNEVISMLQTHWVYEQHHYDEPELILSFEPVEHPKRLRAPPNAPIIIITDSEEQTEPLKPRYLQHRVPESVHDVDFQIPGPLLRTRFLTWFREDLTRLWHFDDPERPLIGGIGSGARGDSMFEYGYNPDFNSAEVADDRFVKCMSLGTSETARTLREESNFYLAHKDFIVGKEGALWPTGHAVRRFADFRGAKRAALQQCIEHFGIVDGDVDAADAGAEHFRKLVLPTPWREKERIRAEAQKIIVFPPLALKEPPAGEKIDPFGFVYWHDQMLRNHDERARNVIPSMQQGHAKRFAADKLSVLPSWNFMGPFNPTLVPRHIDIKHAQATRFRNMITQVEIANRRAPRKLLDDILENFRLGCEVGKPAQDVLDELDRQKKDLPTGEEYRPISPDDHHWMRFIVGPSTNDLLMEEIEDNFEDWRFELFNERLQILLNDPYKDALLARAGQHRTSEQICHEINGFAATNPLQEALYSKEEAEEYCDYLVSTGRLSQSRSGKGKSILFGRPELPYHPELRINFYVPPIHVNPLFPSRPEQELPAPEAPLLDWKAALVAALPLIASFIDASGPSHEERVALAYRTLAYRLGRWTVILENEVEAAYAELKAQGADQGFSIPVDRYRVQIDDLHGIWRQEVTSQLDEVGAVSYASVARAADPGAAHDWQDWASGTWHPEAIEAVRTGLIKELSEGDNMLWPVRPRWEGEPGKETMTLAREDIWDFGREGVRGRNKQKKQFFSLDKWPLHLQSEATQRKNRASGPSPSPPPHDENDMGKGKGEESTTRGVKASVTLENETAVQTGVQDTEPAVVDTSEDGLGLELHLTADPKRQFVADVSGYRKGDTPRQKAAVDEAILDEMREGM
ncbi:hypothetical protein D7B24_008935 [Verticillium nonalfalfae]|uniref:Uncharacterized protein n=1 Tax=Verticillium nonalfalfae TaxID=1051616 RepID=A0A3M9Y3Y4_9PEZI|nr:uncharacterized protein D7B24_008935 [Verticillium nonalfalfae]RNJ55157.1 hypothetical protein D7B24_008935 [Verticillium nonalfalfae]